MTWRGVFLAALLIIPSEWAFAGVALFANATDTIQVGSGTTLEGASTFEVRILFTPLHSRSGLIFNEWTNSAEDKILYVDVGNPGGLGGYNYPVGGAPFGAGATLAPNVWHHIAFVYDGSEERFYLDGSEIGSRAASGTIANDAGLPFVGSLFRGVQADAFGGYLDWLRVSDTARYSGTSFVPPASQPASDANTQLLYYFDEAPGSTTVTDQSSFHRDGTVATGFAGATSPVFAPDPLAPSSIGDVNGDGSVNVGDVFCLINYLFAGGPAPIGLPDINADGQSNVQDVFYLINYLFAGGPAPIPVDVPRAITGLKLWLDGSDVNGNRTNPPDGSLVAQWSDKSGLGHHATNTSLGQQPVYTANALGGHGGVNFGLNGSDYLDTDPTADFSFTTATIFMVANHASSQAHFDIAIPGSMANEFLIYDLKVMHHSSAGTFVYRDFVPAPADFYIQAGLFGTTPSDLVNIVDGVTSNAGLVTSGAPTDYTQVTRAATVGWRQAKSFSVENFDGTICEVIVYDRVLSEPEQNLVGTYLAAKYGIAAYGQGSSHPVPPRR